MLIGGFPLVPPEATSEYLKAERRTTNAFELGGILSIQWTAMLAGLIEELTHLFPDSKPVVATRYDGFSPCIPLLALFFSSALPFYTGCIVEANALDQAYQQTGNMVFDASTRALDRSADAHRFRQADRHSFTWFHPLRASLSTQL